MIRTANGSQRDCLTHERWSLSIDQSSVLSRAGSTFDGALLAIRPPVTANGCLG